MTTMKAVRMHGYGGPEVLHLDDAPKPVPNASEVLVRVHASGVNPVDWKVREGYMKQAMPLRMPAVLGIDFSGVIESVGAGVTEFVTGQAVFGRADMGHDGAYAEFVAVPTENIAPKPSGIDHVHAAATPTAALTAWQALLEGHAGAPSAALKPGQSVLVHGAAGGVGGFAVQLARWRGGHVIATASGEHADLVRSLGAEEVIDYTAQRFEDAVHDVDAVLDTIGGDTQERSWRVLKQGGVLVSTVGIQNGASEKDGVRAIGMMAQTDAAMLRQIAALLESGALIVHVSQVLPLADARRAHEESQAGHVEGKLVLSVAD